MRYAFSIFLALAIVIASAASADAGVPITLSASEGSPGTEIVIRGSGIGDQAGKNVTIFFTEPESYFIFLEVIDWSTGGLEDVIRARLPSLSDLAFRLRDDVVTEPEGSPVAFPTSVASYLMGHSVAGTLAIRRVGYGGYANVSEEKAFTVTPSSDPAGELLAYEPDRTASLPEEKPRFTAKREPVKADLSDDGPRYEVAEGPMTAELAPPPGTINSFQPIDPMPGETLVIKGENFGLPIPGKRVVTIYFTTPVTSPAVYMDLDVLSWKDDEIVARIPGVDEEVFRTAPYTENVKILPGNADDLGKHIVGGNLKIVMLPEQANSNTLAIRLRPVSDDPEIYVVDETVPQGGELVIYGSGLGENAGSSEAFYSPVPPLGSSNRFEVNHWGNAIIKLKVPADIKSGYYTVWVRGSEGKVSNRIKVNVRPSVEIPAESPKLKSRPVRIPATNMPFHTGE